MASMYVIENRFGHRDIVLYSDGRMWERETPGNPGVYMGIDYRNCVKTVDEIAEQIVQRFRDNYMTVDEIADGIRILCEMDRRTCWNELAVPSDNVLTRFVARQSDIAEVIA